MHMPKSHSQGQQPQLSHKHSLSMYICIDIHLYTHVQAHILTPTLEVVCLCQQIAASQQPFRQV